MSQRIMCKNCERTLEPGSDPPILKLCLPCIRKTTPAADLNKIARPGIVDEHGEKFEQSVAKNVKEFKPNEAQFRVDTEMYTQETDEGKLVLLAFKITDYKKRPLLDFGVNFAQVEEWYEYMKTLQNEEPE